MSVASHKTLTVVQLSESSSPDPFPPEERTGTHYLHILKVFLKDL